MNIKKYFNLSNLDIYEKLTIAMCLFFLISLIYLGHFHEIGGFGVETDFYGAYADNAEKLLNGERYYDEDHGPGYLFFLIGFYLIFGDFFIAGKFISIISTVLFGFFSFLTIKALFNSKLAFFTALLLFIVVLPMSILASTDMLFSFLFSFSTYLIFRGGKISIFNLFLGGLVVGYAIMTRLNSIVLPIAIIFSLTVFNPENWHWTKTVKALLIFGAAIIITVSPWLIMNTVYYGKPFISGAHQTIGASFLGRGVDKTTTDFAWGAIKETAEEKYDSLSSLFFGNFKSFMIFFLKNIIPYFKMMLFSLIKFPGYLFLAPGILLLLCKINNIQLTYFSIPVFGFLIYCIISYDTRFYIYIAGFFLLLIVYFLFYENKMENYKSYKIRFNIISKVFFIITVLFLVKDSFKEMKANITNEPFYLLKVAEILKKDCKNSDIILARKPHLGYFSNLKTILIPDVESTDNVIEYAKKKNANYIFYGVIEAELRPQLNILQQPDKVETDLRLIYSQNEPNIYLYKIRK